MGFWNCTVCIPSPILMSHFRFVSPARRFLKKKDMLWQELCTRGGAGSWGDLRWPRVLGRDNEPSMRLCDPGCGNRAPKNEFWAPGKSPAQRAWCPPRDSIGALGPQHPRSQSPHLTPGPSAPQPNPPPNRWSKRQTDPSYTARRAPP